MRSLWFWTIFILAALTGTMAFCRIVDAQGFISQAAPVRIAPPVVKIGPSSRVLVRIGHPYRAERRQPRLHKQRVEKHKCIRK